MATPPFDPASEPLGSSSPLVREFNTIVLEQLINNRELDFVPGRFGDLLRTWNKIERGIEEQLIAGGRIFPDEPSGRIAVENDQYFYAESADPNVSKSLWQRIGTNESRFIANDPSTTLILALAIQSKSTAAEDAGAFGSVDDYDYLIVDENSSAALGVTKSGAVAFGNTELMPSDDYSSHSWAVVDDDGRLLLGIAEDGAASSSNMQLAGEDWQPKGLAATDDAGVPAWYIDENGSVVINVSDETAVLSNEIALSIQRSKRDQILPIEGATFYQVEVEPGLDRVLSDANGITRPYLTRGQGGVYMYDTPEPICAIWGSGQSLAMGTGADHAPAGEEVYNSEPPNAQNCIMFDTGLRGVQGADGQPTANITDFLPAKEVFDGSTQGETQGCGLMSWLYRKSQVAGENAGVYLYRAVGRGATSIDDLDKAGGGFIYTDGLADLEKAVEIAALYGKEVRLNYVTWTHGQQDRAAMTRTEYKAKMVQLASDYNTDVNAIIPGNGVVNFVTSQMAAARYGNSSEVSLAQLDAAIEAPNVFLSTPEYIFRYSDAVHLRPIDYAVLGEYQAKAIRSIDKTGQWEPLRPKSASLAGQTITLKFNVPKGALTFDVNHLPHAKNYGLLYSDDLQSAEIRSVKITDSDEIKIQLSQVPTGANPNVSYAFEGINGIDGFMSGAWGNIRDQDETMSFQVAGRRLHNWCVIFKLEL